jgi:transposase-like protein
VGLNVGLPAADGTKDGLCKLVMVGLRPDGTKALLAVADGHRENTQWWLDRLCDLRA